MDCRALLQELNAYLDGELDPALCDGIEEHLAGCRPCRVVVDNLRGTIRLYRHGEPYPLPEVFCERLHATLRARWRERFPREGGTCGTA
jgi:predicted anti-sigma-YlaC factor YlaD